MEKTINIGGVDTKFKATAAVPRLYRIKFRRDIMQDMAKLKQDVEKAQREKTDIPIASLEMFENMAYLMAKHADPAKVPDDIGDWLDGFETFDIYSTFPNLLEMWQANVQTQVVPRKK